MSCCVSHVSNPASAYCKFVTAMRAETVVLLRGFWCRNVSLTFPLPQIHAFSSADSQLSFDVVSGPECLLSQARSETANASASRPGGKFPGHVFKDAIDRFLDRRNATPIQSAFGKPSYRREWKRGEIVCVAELRIRSQKPRFSPWEHCLGDKLLALILCQTHRKKRL